jgi:hypothetical protein
VQAQMVAKGVKMHYFQDVVHKKLIKQMGAEFHNYGTRMGEIRWVHEARGGGAVSTPQAEFSRREEQDGQSMLYAAP